jgi:isocitrate dehydrogenase
LDGNQELTAFAQKLERASLQTIGDGIVTGDMAALTGATASVDTETFVGAIRQRLEELL